MKAFSPTGSEIVATADVIPGNAMCEFLGRDPGGGLKMDYTSEGTRLCWDGAITKTDERGVTLYVAADGTEWPADSISLEGEPLRPKPAALIEEAWRPVLRELLAAGNDEALFEHDDDEHRKALDRMCEAGEAARRLLNAFTLPDAPASIRDRIALALFASLAPWRTDNEKRFAKARRPDGGNTVGMATVNEVSKAYRDADIALAAMGTSPAAPSPDWREIARDLAGALDNCRHQIEQMRGMFGDEDGTIAQALEDAEAAADQYSAAIKIAPAAPAPATRKVWTCFTDGDECAPTVTVHTSEAAAQARVRDDLDLADDEEAGATSERLAELWDMANEGACMIDEHDLPA